MQKSKTQLAFTLIELLVVIAIIGILSGVIMVTMSGSTESARMAKLRVYSNSIRDSLGANLVAEWNFDELTTASNGTSIRESWNNFTTSLSTNNTTTEKLSSSCPSGKCINFDGDLDYVNCSSNALLNITDTITISAWVYPVEDKDYAAIVMDGTGASYSGGVPIELYRIAGGQLRFLSYYNHSPYNSYNPGTATHGAGGNIPLNVWSFVTATFNKNLTVGTSKIYVDAIQVDSRDRATPYSLPILEQIRAIGSYGGAGGWYFNGKIDEVRIYGAAISTSQIRENYVAGLNKLLSNNGITKQEYDQRIVELYHSCALK